MNTPPTTNWTGDIVFIRELQIETIIGIFDWERETKQPIVLDIDMAADIRKGAATDHIDDALDYKAVSKRIMGYVEGTSFQLVETLAERIAEILLQEFGTPWVRVTLNKRGALRGATDVGVIIERSH